MKKAKQRKRPYWKTYTPTIAGNSFYTGRGRYKLAGKTVIISMPSITFRGDKK